MAFDRRSLLSVGAATLATFASGNVAVAQARRSSKTFILVHGAWHSSGIWERVGHQLVAAGHSVIARDFPGHGLDALFPQTYFRRPLDTGAFSREISPVAGITLQDYIGRIVASIRDAVTGGSGPVILVGHSLSGLAITAVAEMYPEYVSNLVYLTAALPAVGVTANDDIFSSYNDNNKAILPLFLGDPTKTGGLRLDWNSVDPGYLAELQNVFYNDVDATTFRAVANMLVPDESAALVAQPTRKTVRRWGSVPRSFIRCGQDHLFLPTLQDYWISGADAFAPANTTVVYRLDSSHSPFVSQFDKLSAVLLDIATRSH